LRVGLNFLRNSKILSLGLDRRVLFNKYFRMIYIAFFSKDESGHMSLDFGAKKKFVSEEVQQEQRAIKSQKRKELELVKREEDKKKTMDRLLLKKDSKATKLIKASSRRALGHNAPKWTYRFELN
jgi:hypothetical protein